MDREFWTEKFFELVRLLLGNVWNRAGLLITLGGLSVLTGWVDKLVMAYTQLKWQETEQWVGWVLLAIGLAMLIYGAWKAKEPNPKDVELINKFRELFRLTDIDFLMNHNFYNNWHVSQTASIEELADSWIGAQYEFVDSKANDLLSEAKALAREFSRAEVMGFSVGPQLQVRTMKTEPDLRYGVSQETKGKIENLNRLARKLAEAVDALEKVAKVRFAGA
jgi:hypothetical protein